MNLFSAVCAEFSGVGLISYHQLKKYLSLYISTMVFCVSCGKSFTWRYSLDKHEKHACKNTDTQPYPKFVCPGCNKQVCKKTLYNHQRKGCPATSLRLLLIVSSRDNQPIFIPIVGHSDDDTRTPALAARHVAMMFWKCSTDQSLSRRTEICLIAWCFGNVQRTTSCKAADYSKRFMPAARMAEHQSRSFFDL